MSLATRCPSCSTVFRVVQDQLRVSEGWVRCGRCGEAFNALEAMVTWPPPQAPAAPGSTPEPAPDPASESPPAADPGIAPEAEAAPEPDPAAAVSVNADEAAIAATRPEPAAEVPEFAPPSDPVPFAPPAGVAFVTSDGALAPQAAHAPTTDVVTEDADASAVADEAGEDARAGDASEDADRTDIVAPVPRPAASGAAGDEAHAPGDEDEARAAREERREEQAGEGGAIGEGNALESDPEPAAAAAVPSSEQRPPRGGGERRARRRDPSAALAAHAGTGRSRAAPQPAPSFVQQADRAARWKRPWVRAGLALLLLLSTLGLTGQAVYAFRDRVAAGVPAARPLLLQACATLGCRIGDYRKIDALTVESSGLSRVDGAPVYRLAVTLHNRATHDVAAPALDLAVTDAQGRQIARRVLTMSELGLPLRTLRPGSEMPITAPLAVDGQVSGYTVEIFYP